MEDTKRNRIIKAKIQEVLREEDLYRFKMNKAGNVSPYITDSGWNKIVDCVNDIIDTADINKDSKVNDGIYAYLDPAEYVNSMGKKECLYLPENDVISLFLAGPCVDGMCTAKDWRKYFTDALKAKLYNVGFLKQDTDLYIYTPTCFYDNAIDFSDREKEKLYHKWCRDVMDHVTYIVFWIPRYIDKGELGLHTNIEIGRYLSISNSRCIVGWPKDADKVNYIEDLVCALNGNLPEAIQHNMHDLANLTANKIMSTIKIRKSKNIDMLINRAYKYVGV
jgi:hypothetical protein